MVQRLEVVCIFAREAADSLSAYFWKVRKFSDLDSLWDTSVRVSENSCTRKLIRCGN